MACAIHPDGSKYKMIEPIEKGILQYLCDHCQKECMNSAIKRQSSNIVKVKGQSSLKKRKYDYIKWT